ncbi:DiGeorge syndrome critical region protein 14 [Mortierella sp. GBA43]|nr:DiGeorge syndrome critical region protein 14 [Mortierella sp. GBA43]
MTSKELVRSSDTPTSLITTTKYKSNVPPPAPQQVLEEDEYIEALGKIIERDFFPDLAKLRRQHAYLDAVEMNDVERIAATAKDIAGNDTPLGQRRMKTPARTPKILGMGLADQSWTPARVDIGNATPSWRDDGRMAAVDATPDLRTPSGIDSEKQTKRSVDGVDMDPIDTSLSLDQFQARYTSEDNASFIEIVEKINAQKREKYRWLYEQGRKGQMLIENGQSSSQKLLREAGEVDNQDVGASAESSNLALVVKDKRSGTIPTWDYKSKNTLMYYPEGFGTLLEEKDIRAAPKEIIHRNTGFQGRDLLVVNQAAAAKLDSTRSTKVDLTGTPKVGGYSFVSSTPSPSMSQMGEDPDMLTWGAIEDEPLLISSGIDDSGPSPFKLPPTPRRELIAQRLQEKASKRFRENSSLKAKVFASPSLSALSEYHNALGGTTPTPRFNSPYSVTSTPTRGTTGSNSRTATAQFAGQN